MNKLNKLKSVAILVLMPLSAVSADPAKKKDFTHEFMAGLESYKYHYGESRPNQSNVMKYNGVMFGVGGSYELTYKDRVFLRPEARAAYGFTSYTNYKNSKYPKASAPNLTFEPRLLVGGNISLSKTFKLSPYIGLGYRYKSDDGSDLVSEQNGKLRKRLSQYWYIPVGSCLNHDFNDLWFIKAMVEYDWFISGRQFEYFTDGTYPSPLVYKQKKGWGAKGELLVGHRFDKVSITFGPYMNYWKIGKSQIVQSSFLSPDYPRPLTGPAWEPRNVTKEIGVKLNFYF